MKTVILVSADDTRLWEVRGSLADLDVEVARQYSSSSALLAALPGLSDSVDLIIIDQVIEPMNGWDLAREITSKFPALSVSMVVDNPMPEDYARAMDANARSVISYPLQYEDVAQKVGSALQWTQTVRTAVRSRAEDQSTGSAGKMVTISSAKGGTGSTTIATHLAMAAAKADPQKSVVLVDMDLQKPDLSVVLNVPQYRTINDLLTVIDELTPRQLNDVLYRSPHGYSVLFGPLNGEESELVSEKAAQHLLGMLRSRFDLVIVDTGSVMGEANSTAVEMADDNFIVATSDVLALRGAKRLAQLWVRLGIRPNENSKVILNKVDKKQDLQPEAAKKIVGLPVVPEYIPESIRSIEYAMNRRDPSIVAPVWSVRIHRLGVEMGIVAKESLDLPPAHQERKRNSRSRNKNRKAGEKGSGAVEFAGITILFAFIAALGFQVIMMGATWIFAAGAANEGARAAAVGESAEAAASSHTPPLWKDGLSVTETADKVEVVLDTPTLAKVSEDFAFAIPASAGIVRE